VEKGKEKERKEMKIKVRLVLEAQVWSKMYYSFHYPWETFPPPTHFFPLFTLTQTHTHLLHSYSATCCSFPLLLSLTESSEIHKGDWLRMRMTRGWDWERLFLIFCLSSSNGSKKVTFFCCYSENFYNGSRLEKWDPTLDCTRAQPKFEGVNIQKCRHAMRMRVCLLQGKAYRIPISYAIYSAYIKPRLIWTN
jgi:hypothetical protein